MQSKCCFENCSKPCFVDSKTNIASKYCSKSHMKLDAQQKEQQNHGNLPLQNVPIEENSLEAFITQCAHHFIQDRGIPIQNLQTIIVETYQRIFQKGISSPQHLKEASLTDQFANIGIPIAIEPYIKQHLLSVGVPNNYYFPMEISQNSTLQDVIYYCGGKFMQLNLLDVNATQQLVENTLFALNSYGISTIENLIHNLENPELETLGIPIVFEYFIKNEITSFMQSLSDNGAMLEASSQYLPIFQNELVTQNEPVTVLSNENQLLEYSEEDHVLQEFDTTIEDISKIEGQQEERIQQQLEDARNQQIEVEKERQQCLEEQRQAQETVQKEQLEEKQRKEVEEQERKRKEAEEQEQIQRLEEQKMEEQQESQTKLAKINNELERSHEELWNRVDEAKQYDQQKDLLSNPTLSSSLEQTPSTSFVPPPVPPLALSFSTQNLDESRSQTPVRSTSFISSNDTCKISFADDSNADHFLESFKGEFIQTPTHAIYINKLPKTVELKIYEPTNTSILCELSYSTQWDVKSSLYDTLVKQFGHFQLEPIHREYCFSIDFGNKVDMRTLSHSYKNIDNFTSIHIIQANLKDSSSKKRAVLQKNSL